MKNLKIVTEGKSSSDQRGFVMILTMVMLAVLSILGVMVLNTTDTELGITSNYRMNSEAFTGTEMGIEYAKYKVVNDHGDVDADGTYDLLADDDDTIVGMLPDGVELVATGRNEINFFVSTPPPGMFTNTSLDAYQKNIYYTSDALNSDEEGDAAYYRVSVEARKNGRATARVETLFVNRGGQVY
ncbi:MAG: hypothetical protein C0622_03120 [Desulfuromonas sp.]|nr:MAG: hypothetical protein C0622_03120 [Desulfuromonas sp.]